jgi:DsbC/DsbD-like thiol-disulfide interchange protein
MTQVAVSALALTFALAVTATAQRPTDIVKWSAEAPSAAVRAGGTAKIALTARIEEGWKLYSLTQPKGGPIPLAIGVAKGAPFTLAAKDITSPPPKVQKDEVFSKDTQYYEDEAAFVLPVAVPKMVTPGDHTVPVEVTFQACGKEICLRPFTQKLEVKVTVTR